MENIINQIVEKIRDAGYDHVKYTPDVYLDGFTCSYDDIITITGKGYMYTILIHEFYFEKNTFPAFEGWVRKGRREHCYYSKQTFPEVHPSEWNTCLIPGFCCIDIAKKFVENGNYNVEKAVSFLIEQFEDAESVINNTKEIAPVLYLYK